MRAREECHIKAMSVNTCGVFWSCRCSHQSQLFLGVRRLKALGCGPNSIRGGRSTGSFDSLRVGPIFDRRRSVLAEAFRRTPPSRGARPRPFTHVVDDVRLTSASGSVRAGRPLASRPEHYARIHPTGRELHRRLVQHIMRHPRLGRGCQLACCTRRRRHANRDGRRVQPADVLHAETPAGDLHRLGGQLRRRLKCVPVRHRELRRVERVEPVHHPMRRREQR